MDAPPVGTPDHDAHDIRQLSWSSFRGQQRRARDGHLPPVGQGDLLVEGIQAIREIVRSAWQKETTNRLERDIDFNLSKLLMPATHAKKTTL